MVYDNLFIFSISAPQLKPEAPKKLAQAPFYSNLFNYPEPMVDEVFFLVD